MSSWQGWAHTIVGLLYFAVTSVIPLVAWRTFRGHPEWRSTAPLSLVIGVVVIGLFVAGPFLFGAERVGLYQRVTLLTVGAWAVVVSRRMWQLLSHAENAQLAHTPARVHPV